METKTFDVRDIIEDRNALEDKLGEAAEMLKNG